MLSSIRRAHWAAKKALGHLRFFCSLPQASVDEARRILRVKLPSDPEAGLFPFTWLRDNCRCDSCFHHPSGQRRLLLHHLDVESRVQCWRFAENASSLQVQWQDGHRSEYDLQWLQGRSFGRKVMKRLLFDSSVLLSIFL